MSASETTPLALNDYCSPLPKDRSVRIGCIGAGFIMADCHLVAYKNAGLNVVGISSRSHEKAIAVAERHHIANVYESYQELLENEEVEIVDIAVPPDIQLEVIEAVVKQKSHLKGILAQKPLGANLEQARRIVELCEDAGIVLAVNQNMRYDHSVRACKSLLERGEFGEPVLATIDMRAIPHWMPWQERQGWLTLRIMSIHHLDTFRYWFGDPVRVYASVRSDPRTARNFRHQDGICMYILEFENGLRAMSCDDVWAGPDADQVGMAVNEAIGINWRVEGTTGIARGTIGWPKYPERTPSTIDYLSEKSPEEWQRPRWEEVWFPDAFIGPMSELMIALEENRVPANQGRDNLKTMELVEACYQSAEEHRAIELPLQ